MAQRIIEGMNGSRRQSATLPQPLQSFIKPKSCYQVTGIKRKTENMKSIKTLEASKALIVAIKADAKTSDTIAGLVRKLHAEASKAGHEEKAITEFVKETMAELYGEQTALFHIRWNAARQAMFKARKATKAPAPYKLPAKLKSAVLDTLKKNNLIDKAEQRKALLAIVKAL
jgi:hypothetical protein